MAEATILVESYVPSEGEILELGFTKKHVQSDGLATWYEKQRPCPGGYERLVIEVTSRGRVFFTRIARKHEEMWNGHRLPSREFWQGLLDSFGWDK